MAIPTDSELISACLEGDTQAWGQLTDRYVRLVVRVARRSGLDADRAADAAQEAFLALWRNLGRVRDTASLAGWLATTARRRAWRIARLDANRLRREEGRARLEVDPAPLPAEVVLEEERRHLVRRGFASLGERCRRLLDALFFQPQRAYGELAADLGMAVGSIGPTRKRCLEKLRLTLAEGGLSPEHVSGSATAGSSSLDPDGQPRRRT